jgi:hypothetical protein
MPLAMSVGCDVLYLLVRTSLTLAVYPAERGPGGAPGETPNELSAEVIVSDGA